MRRSKEAASGREFQWLGRVIAEAFEKANANAAQEFLRVLQTHLGPSVAGRVINAMRECDIEITPERRQKDIDSVL
jgi:hypothetical protein